MKHASIVLTAAVFLVIGFALRGSIDLGGRPPPRAPSGAPAPAQAPQRPQEDPRAVYRVPVDDTPTKGPADALVTIVEVSDFECPFCKRVLPTLKQLDEAYPGKLRWSFRQNPLPFHPRALPAAMATEEARAQGGDEKFWAMHDRLFAAQTLDDTAIESAALDVGLDVAKVKEAVQTAKHRARVERDQALVNGLGARGTPAFFINGRKVSGAQPFEAFRAVVEEELRKAEAMVRSGTPAAEVYARIIEKGSTAPVMTGGAPGQPPAALAAPPPPPPTVYRKVPVRADDPARGPKDAKLTVVLFSDFQCPFCARVEPTLKQLEEAFPGQVRVTWKHQPIAQIHPNALGASLAAEAAREQGKFWPMHEVLFQHQRELDAANLPRYAKEAGLDVARFEKSLAARRGQDRIAEDQQLAGRVDASATPTMFFNCRQVVGAQPFERLRAAAEEELRKADALLAGKRPDAGFYEKACEANLAAAPAPAPAQGALRQPVEAIPAALTAADVPVRPDDPVRGNPKAPVTVVLFSDFQCPFCARVGPALDQLQREYGDKVRVAWKHQPLGMHPQALPAAEAAEAAREQGKFWPMHDRLFAAQRELSADTYRRIAREIGLDLGKFDAAVASGRNRTRIQEDQAVASRVGAGGTPTMFVNGERVVGAVPYEQLKAVVDRKLAAR
jgi:protein-disulfide isomerase